MTNSCNDAILKELADIRRSIVELSKERQATENLVDKIDQFDALMRGAKETQVNLARAITEILSLLQKLEENVAQRFDNYEAAVKGIRETQQNLASQIQSIASRIK